MVRGGEMSESDGIDDILERLRGGGADPRLEAMDEAVLAGLAAHRARRAARRGLALSGVAALGIGLASSLAMPPRASAESVPLLMAAPASAPSNLLLGVR
jgi:hypothetical protein